MAEMSAYHFSPPKGMPPSVLPGCVHTSVLPAAAAAQRPEPCARLPLHSRWQLCQDRAQIPTATAPTHLQPKGHKALRRNHSTCNTKLAAAFATLPTAAAAAAAAAALGG
jgi:hypothetical protein